MPTDAAQNSPQRSSKHDALDVFLGSWMAEGMSYGGTEQPANDPRRNGVPWTSTHVGRWYSGDFFLLQDEKARPGGNVFDTLSVMGVGDDGEYFARSFENHGFTRQYRVTVDGRVWHLSGEHERAWIEFSGDGRTQTIRWEWRPQGTWLPLCDRVAVRQGAGQSETP